MTTDDSRELDTEPDNLAPAMPMGADEAGAAILREIVASAVEPLTVAVDALRQAVEAFDVALHRTTNEGIENHEVGRDHEKRIKDLEVWRAWHEAHDDGSGHGSK